MLSQHTLSRIVLLLELHEVPVHGLLIQLILDRVLHKYVIGAGIQVVHQRLQRDLQVVVVVLCESFYHRECRLRAMQIVKVLRVGISSGWVVKTLGAADHTGNVMLAGREREQSAHLGGTLMNVANMV